MKFINNKTYQSLGILVLLIFTAWLFAKNPFQSFPNHTPAGNQPPGNSSSTPPDFKTQDGDQTQTGTQTVEGVLKISNDLKRGNLMLTTDNVTIYLFTSRDFSSLLDQRVIVSYKGSLDNFTLQNIVQK